MKQQFFYVKTIEYWPCHMVHSNTSKVPAFKESRYSFVSPGVRQMLIGIPALPSTGWVIGKTLGELSEPYFTQIFNMQKISHGVIFNMYRVLRKSLAYLRHSICGISVNSNNRVVQYWSPQVQMCFEIHNCSDFRKILHCLYSGLAV